MIKVFEAFAGYGTASFALKELGVEFELVGFSEIDKYAVQCFEQNHGGKNFGDITKIDWSEVPDFDLLTGGFPCTSFSMAGKQLGQDDPRGVGNLGLELTKALKEKQPKYFLFENVKGFMSKKFMETKNYFLKSWVDMGYNIYYDVINTKDYGVPQNRERVFFIGIRKDIEQRFVFPQPFELKLKIFDLLEDNPNSKYILNNSALNTLNRNFGSKGKIIKDISPTLTQSMGTGGGNVNCVIDKKYYLNQKQIDSILNSSFNSRRALVQKKDICSCLAARDYKEPKCLMLDVSQIKREGKPRVYEDVGRTLNTAQGGGHTPLIINPYNGKQSYKETGTIGTSVGLTTGKTAQLVWNQTPRKITPKECFRLQGFLRDQINLEGLSDTQKYRLAGNGQSLNVVTLIFKELLGKEVNKNLEAKE